MPAILGAGELLLRRTRGACVWERKLPTFRRSKNQREAGPTNVAQAPPVMAPKQDSGTPSSVKTSGQAASGPPTAMDNAIRRHRRVHAVLRRLSGNPARSVWTPAGLAVRTALLLLHPVERFTWRRLLSRRAASAEEASQKALYLIALAMAQRKTLQREDVLIAAESVKEFREQLSEALGTSQRRYRP